MLKIEVIRFEAEDVITASVEAPVVPEQKPVECTCPTATAHSIDGDGRHVVAAESYTGEDGNRYSTPTAWCPASEHTGCVIN